MYSTGKDNVYLGFQHISIWIFNACLYAIIISLIYYIVVAPSFETVWLYGVGTTVFTGLCVSLSAKVAFMHQEWTMLQASILAGSIAAMFIFYLILASAQYDYYNDAIQFFSLGIYWFFGVFSIVFFTLLIDVIPYYTQVLFKPTREMMYKEVERNVSYSIHVFI